MYLRKQRRHGTGQSNTDYKFPYIFHSRSQDFIKQFENYHPSIDHLAFHKPKNFNEIIRQKMNRTAPTPFKDARQFYVENKRKLKEKEEISKPRESQLEEKSKRKKVFTGESNTIYCKYNVPKEEAEDYEDMTCKSKQMNNFSGLR